MTATLLVFIYHCYFFLILKALLSWVGLYLCFGSFKVCNTVRILSEKYCSCPNGPWRQTFPNPEISSFPRFHIFNRTTTSKHSCVPSLLYPLWHTRPPLYPTRCCITTHTNPEESVRLPASATPRLSLIHHFWRLQRSATLFLCICVGNLEHPHPSSRRHFPLTMLILQGLSSNTAFQICKL